MTKKIAISVPDDVAERLAREPNVSAFVADSVRSRMVSESVRAALAGAGFVFTDQDLARVAHNYAILRASVTPDMRRRSAEVRALIKRTTSGAEHAGAAASLRAEHSGTF
jgi:hypothetical protein